MVRGIRLPQQSWLIILYKDICCGVNKKGFEWPSAYKEWSSWCGSITRWVVGGSMWINRRKC